jgi:hypothetical protein
MGALLRPGMVSMERIGRDAWLDLFAAAPPDYAAEAGVRSQNLNGYTLLGNKAVPISEFNRATGLNIDGPFTERDLEHALDWLAECANPAWAIQLPPDTQSDIVDGWMRKRGIRKSGSGWAIHEREPHPIAPDPRQNNLEVRLVDQRDSKTFGQVVANGFGLPISVAPWFSSLVGRPKWRTYLAYDGDVPAACAALYLNCGWGWMGVDATLPDYRGRGAQTALINCRISDAIAVGAIGLIAETGQPPPGEAKNSPSYQNYLRAGFRTAYVRPNYRAA